ncbi:DedA family protein [Methylomonas fluvii]|uniref:DedA family protein n=1 Tax=Methylomonas fluvii TaxID=1854564 RepID=A0ABR9DKI5_9GAMM|nr:DedA family protein [Methylomonas fluvii]MBD9363530.1 DedA family protein [Methylomonas fluvii]CAD6876819.1 DedA protein [Methylomonas fluvii]
MDWLHYLTDILLHIDKHLANIISDYGTLTYAILFLVIFVETGFVVMPFLPGDSLLFAAGAFVAMDAFNLPILLGVLGAAAVLGDTVNYWIGRSIGLRAYSLSWVNREHLDRAQAFYDTYGGKTIVLARFVPIVRTFAPFVAGIGKMPYSTFILYNIIGGVAWVLICVFAGYFFGNIPLVKKNFELVVLGIVLISILPIVLEVWKARKQAKH